VYVLFSGTTPQARISIFFSEQLRLILLEEEAKNNGRKSNPRA
jgi:hypothetical protein